VTTQVTSPQSKGMVESLVKTLKRDYAKLAERPNLQAVMEQLPKWFDDYNFYHPQSALGYVPPKLFREKRALIKHTGGTGLRDQDHRYRWILPRNDW
jgi:putative transposase